MESLQSNTFGLLVTLTFDLRILKMYTALPLVMIYLPTKFEGDLLKNKGDIAEPIQAVKKEKEKE